MAARNRKICIFAPSFGDGGVERMLVNLASEFVAGGVQVDLIANGVNSPYLRHLPDNVRLKAPLGVSRKRYPDFLERHLQRFPAEIVLSSKPEDDRVVRETIKRLPDPPRFIIRCPAAFLTRMRLRHENPIKVFLKKRDYRKSFDAADAVIAVSDCVKAEVAQLIPAQSRKIVSIKNPNVTSSRYELARESISHPWLQPASPPVVLGIGGLRRQKNFSTLIKAFALFRHEFNSRLVILGEGRQRSRLEKLADQLGIGPSVDFPGFVENPYPFVANAALFVLSSLWEGSPNVLVEALALGTPVVSTECRCGPSEILESGLYGKLVPIRDPVRLADAMVKTFRNPLPPEILRRAVESYGLRASAEAYLQAFESVLTIEASVTQPS